jgi:hypothetical protein
VRNTKVKEVLGGNPEPLQKQTALGSNQFESTSAVEASQQADSEFERDFGTVERILYKYCQFTGLGDAYLRGKGYERVFVEELLDTLRYHGAWSKPAKEGK